MVKVAQINAGKRPAAAIEINNRVMKENLELIFIQEPSGGKNHLTNFQGGKIFSGSNIKKRKRAAIWVKNELIQDSNCIVLPQFTSRDIVSVQCDIRMKKGERKKIIFCSIYAPRKDDDEKDISNPINNLTERLLIYCFKLNINLILGGDFNAHNDLWGDCNIDSRGESLIEALNPYNLHLLNKGSTPTFLEGDRRSVIDLTFVNKSFSRYVTGWQVDKNPSFSDHRFIIFEIITDKVAPMTTRSKRRTNWSKLTNIVHNETLNLKIDIIKPVDLENGADKITKILKNAYEKCSTLKVVKVKNNSDWFNKSLDLQRKRVRKLWNLAERATRNKNPKRAAILQEAYKKEKNEYNTSCMKAKRNSWKANMTKIDDIGETARLVKFMENDNRARLGSLQRDDGSFTTNLDDSYKLLMETHFPGCKSKITKEIPETFLKTCQNDLDIEKAITKPKISWAINSLKPFKASGEDGIFPALIQKCEDSIIDHLQTLFKASLKHSYIPNTWRGTLVKFLPKAGKPNYDNPKAFRPISLMSFFLKILEKLMDRKIREETLVKFPLNDAQHAYQKHKGTDTALHSLVNFIERQFSFKNPVIGIFVDIEGAFDVSGFDTIINALNKREVDPWAVEWISSMLAQRLIKIGENDKDYYSPIKGCAQGGCISPLLWCLVIDSLLNRLTEAKFFVSAYADDVGIFLAGSNQRKGIISEQLEKKAMKILSEWCIENGLTINASKSNAILFQSSSKLNQNLSSEIKLNNQPIPQSKSIRYLGVEIDCNLLWNKHIAETVKKGKRTLWAIRGITSSNWGINPNRLKWIYEQIIRPRVTYGSVVWWHRTDINKNKNLLDSLQRNALQMITNSFKTTPTIALEALLNIPPLSIKVKSCAIKTYARLKSNNCWKNADIPTPHKRVSDLINFDISEFMNRDFEWIEPRFKVVIGERNNWISTDTYDEIWFTDGSVRSGKVGIGCYNSLLNTEISMRVSDNCSSYMAEIIALNMASKECIKKGLQYRNILIATDSATVLKNLKKIESNDNLINECVKSLNKLSIHNTVTICWCPAHSKIKGNEHADHLAKEGTRKNFVQVSVKSSSIDFDKEIEKWEHSKSMLNWRHSKNKMTICKRYIKPFNKIKAEKLIKMSKTKLRTVIGLLSGHASTNGFLKKFGKTLNDRCRFCKHENISETTLHLLSECEALERLRYKHFLDGKPTDKCILNADFKPILKFAKESKIIEKLFERKKFNNDGY